MPLTRALAAPVALVHALSFEVADGRSRTVRIERGINFYVNHFFSASTLLLLGDMPSVDPNFEFAYHEGGDTSPIRQFIRLRDQRKVLHPPDNIPQVI